MNKRILQSLGISILTLGMMTSLEAQGTSKAPKQSELDDIGKRNINKGNVNFTSLDAEAKLGRQAAAEIEREVTIVENADIHAYVDRIAQNIAKNSDSMFPITIKIVQSNEVNAFALPGGFIYVNTGIIKAVDNEAELAFVIAHLVGSVAARHATETNSKGTLLQTLQTPSVTLSGGVAANAIQQVSQTALPVGMFRFTRAAIKEADFLGLEYLYQAGYDPQAAVSFFRKLEAMEATRPKSSSLFDTHPPAAERVKLTESHIQRVLPVRAIHILNTSEFDVIRERVK